MFVNEVKYNGILFWTEDHDWGRSVHEAESEPVLGQVEAEGSKEYKLNPYDIVINGYVYGADAEEKIAQLNECFTSEQPGWLELPRLGKIKVKFKGQGFRFKFEGRKECYGKITLELEKYTDSGLKIVQVQEDTAGQIDDILAEAEASFLEKFDENFSLDGFPEFVKMGSFDTFTSISSKISKLSSANLVSSVLDPITGSASILTSGKDGILGTFKSYLNFDGSSYKNQIKALLGIAKSKSSYKAATSSKNDLQILSNSVALDDLSKEVAISNIADIVAKNDVFETTTEANDFVDEITEVANDFTADVDDYAVQTNIFKMVNVIVNKVKFDKNLAVSKRIKINQVMPASVVAYQNGVDSDKLIRLNKVKHPLFVPAGTELEA